MPYQRALAHRLGFEPGSPDYETTALQIELSRLLFFVFLLLSFKVKRVTLYPPPPSPPPKKKVNFFHPRFFIFLAHGFFFRVCIPSILDQRILNPPLKDGTFYNYILTIHLDPSKLSDLQTPPKLDCFVPSHNLCKNVYMTFVAPKSLTYCATGPVIKGALNLLRR